MNKELLAKQINFTADYATRAIKVGRINYKEDDIIIVEKAESWAYESDSSFSVEDFHGMFQVVFTCSDLPCHRVDYDNEEEVEILNAVEGEGEVLVPAGVKFRIVSVSTEEDFQEMGYYEIELEIVEE